MTFLTVANEGAFEITSRNKSLSRIFDVSMPKKEDKITSNPKSTRNDINRMNEGDHFRQGAFAMALCDRM